MSRLADDPFYVPGEHGPKLFVDLGKVSPVGCGRFELDARLSIVERLLGQTS